jgi:hypothetical protein
MDFKLFRAALKAESPVIFIFIITFQGYLAESQNFPWITLRKLSVKDGKSTSHFLNTYHN